MVWQQKQKGRTSKPKGHCSNLIFEAVSLLQEVVLSSCVESLLLKQKPNFDPLASWEELRVSSSSQGSHCQKCDCHALRLFALDRAIPRLFSISRLYFYSRRDQNRARQINRLERVATLFLVVRGIEGWHKHPCAELTRTAFGSPNSIYFQPKKWASNKSSNLICRVEFNHRVKEYDYIYSIFENRMNPWFTLEKSFDFITPADSVRRLRCARCCFDILGFQFQPRCLRFLRFSVFNFNRTDKAFEFFGLGMLYYYKKGSLNRWPPRSAIILPKGLGILVRLCSQVPAKVQSALLVACVRSLRGRRGLSPKTNNASKDQNKTEQAITMPNENKKKNRNKSKQNQKPNTTNTQRATSGMVKCWPGQHSWRDNDLCIIKWIGMARNKSNRTRTKNENRHTRDMWEKATQHCAETRAPPSQEQSPVGDISVVTLIRTETTLDHSQKAE